MKRNAIFATVLLLSPSLFAKDKAQIQVEGRAIIERAIKVSDLRDPSVGPFVLKATRLATKDAPEAKYVFFWSAPNYREEVTENGRTEVRVGNATTVWRQHRTYIAGHVFHTFFNSLDIAGHLHSSSSHQITGIRLAKQKGVQLQCVSLQNDKDESELCFDPGPSALIRTTTAHRIEVPCPPNRSCTQPFGLRYASATVRSNWAEFKGVLIARELRSQSEKSPLTEWRIDALEMLENPQPSLFEPEPGAEAWVSCEAPKSAMPMSGGINLDDVGALRTIRDARVQLILTPEGRISEGFVISEQEPGDGAKVIDYFKRQQYTPARCGDKPVQGELVFNWSGEHR